MVRQFRHPPDIADPILTEWRLKKIGEKTFLSYEPNVLTIFFEAKNTKIPLPWWSCPWPIPTFALKTFRSAKSRSKWRPEGPNDGKIILILKISFLFYSTLPTD
jgi:hypothetical protein